jgi:hypothetical protein
VSVWVILLSIILAVATELSRSYLVNLNPLMCFRGLSGLIAVGFALPTACSASASFNSTAAPLFLRE